MKPDSNTKLSRREFVRKSAAASTAFGSFSIVPRHVLGGPGKTPPSEVITRAVIGTGGMGRNHIRTNRQGEPPQTLAVCDVDDKHLTQALKKGGAGCKGYKDWREVIDRDDIDVVHIGTPPHWHALLSIAASISLPINGTPETIAPETLKGTVITLVKTHPETNKATKTIMDNFFIMPLNYAAIENYI